MYGKHVHIYGQRFGRRRSHVFPLLNTGIQMQIHCMAIIRNKFNVTKENQLSRSQKYITAMFLFLWLASRITK